MIDNTLHPRAFTFLGFLAALSLALSVSIVSYAGTEITPGPGTPDELQLKHYESLKANIKDKNRTEALAALALFQADIMQRWQTNSLVEMMALTELLELTKAVDGGDWKLASKILTELKQKYRPGS